VPSRQNCCSVDQGARYTPTGRTIGDSARSADAARSAPEEISNQLLRCDENARLRERSLASSQSSIAHDVWRRPRSATREYSSVSDAGGLRPLCRSAHAVPATPSPEPEGKEWADGTSQPAGLRGHAQADIRGGTLSVHPVIRPRRLRTPPTGQLVLEL